MECARCGTLNDPGRKFCRQCGEALVVLCAVCGAANEPGDRFCGACGSPLTVPDARPAYDEGDTTERRLVSVLFVDLVGFTTFSEGRDAEDVRAMLSRIFDIATEAVVDATAARSRSSSATP